MICKSPLIVSWVFNPGYLLAWKNVDPYVPMRFAPVQGIFIRHPQGYHPQLGDVESRTEGVGIALGWFNRFYAAVSL